VRGRDGMGERRTTGEGGICKRGIVVGLANGLREGNGTRVDGGRKDGR
jgi:hypothetical protein